MTDSEWNGCTDPQKMLDFLRGSGKASDRKLRLFACASVRRIWSLLIDERSRGAVEVAEVDLDGQLNPGARSGAKREAHEAAGELNGRLSQMEAEGQRRLGQVQAMAATAASALLQEVGIWAFATPGQQSARDAATAAAEITKGAALVSGAAGRSAAKKERSAQCHLLRDILGSPFRPAPLVPACITSEVVALARAAYEHRLFPCGHLDPARLAVLADSLEEAGCDDAELLGHLRSEGLHVRGCWAVDAVLEKG